MSTYNVLEAARKLGVRNVVLASSETLIGIPLAEDGHVISAMKAGDEEGRRLRRLRGLGHHQVAALGAEFALRPGPGSPGRDGS